MESFHLLVGTLLKDPAEREQFFKVRTVLCILSTDICGNVMANNSCFLAWQEEFPVDYGPVFDQELEKLLWEFLIRLDQLLPVPNLRQVCVCVGPACFEAEF